ncbi:MAG: VWA domain-containing protein, partial [Myxococcales bacterium]|nr:VWA domain-containing protein [Myxococcales bacterium]
GSMGGEPMHLLRESVRHVAGQLRSGDVVSLVQWDTSQGIVLQGHVVAGPDDPTLLEAIENLDAGGGTDLFAGLTTAYALAESSYIQGGINRVVLISDGGANAGVTSINLIANAAEAEDGGGIYLIGVGVGEAEDYSDALMDTVTDAGKGAYLFIDNASEAALQFGPERFVSNVAVAARNVQMAVTLPWYFG